MRDVDIRRVLRREVEIAHRDDPGTLILEEIGLCQGVSRIDMAVINGTVHGFEIKSDRDTLARLPAQAGTYSQVCDFVTIVASKSHEAKIRALVPEWWGICIASESEGRLQLKNLREASRNKGVKPEALAQLLWRDEVVEALTALQLIDGYRSKKREILWRRLATAVSLDMLGEIVRAAIKKRPAQRQVILQSM